MKKIIYLSLFLLVCCFSLQAMSTKSNYPLSCIDTYESFTESNLCDSLISPAGTGKVWYTSGIYNDTIMNAGGCDSIMTFNLVFGSSESFVLTNLCDSLVSPAGTGKVWYTTGVYYDTITNAKGCDSIMTFNLTFGTSESFVLTNLCDSLVSPAGTGKVWYTTGVYFDTITNAKGCDSVMTFNLTFGTTESFVYTNLCDSLVSPSGSGKTWYTTGVYKDTIMNAKGCDSVMTFNLTFGTTASFNMPNVCDSLISPSGKVWKNTGIYKDTIMNAKGCDSVMTFNLVIGKTTTASFVNHDICDYKISPSGKTWNVDGIYLDTILNVSGCDSIMTFDLTFKYSTSASFTPAICDSLITASGKVYKTSGVVIDTINNSVGCDSIITYNLTILNPTPSTSVMPASGLVCSGDTIIASGTCANGVLKWYSDANHTSLKSVGASDTTYVAVPGNYSVYGFCEGSGGCLSVVPGVVSYTVGGIPMAPPSGNANPSMTCAGDSSVLTVTGCSGGSIEWYDNSMGTGTPFAYGFTTKVAPSVTKSYFGYCVMPGGCKSAFGKTVTVTVDPCNTTSVDSDFLDNKVSFYPNPFKDNLTVTISNELLDEQLSLTIYNSVGKQVKTIGKISETNLDIDLSHYDKGIYFITVIGNKTNMSETVRVVKQ